MRTLREPYLMSSPAVQADAELEAHRPRIIALTGALEDDFDSDAQPFGVSAEYRTYFSGREAVRDFFRRSPGLVPRSHRVDEVANEL